VTQAPRITDRGVKGGMAVRTDRPWEVWIGIGLDIKSESRPKGLGGISLAPKYLIEEFKFRK
jgi:hypothetical protein